MHRISRLADAWRNKFLHLNFDAALHSCGAGVQLLHRSTETVADADRTWNSERPGAPTELTVEEQERQTAEVVPMQ